MNLVARDLEKKVRALHRAELNESPELRSEFKRLRKSENQSFSRLTRRLLMPVFWNAIFLNIALKTRDEALTAAVISLWAAASAFRWGHQWFQQFYASEDLIVLNLLPLNDGQIFRFQAARYLKAARWTAWELLLAYGVLAMVEGPSGIPIIYFLLAALLQSLLVLALALHAASRLHMLPLSGIASLLYATALSLLFLGSQEMDLAQVVVNASNWFLPTGWLNYILLQATADPVTLALLIPIAAIIYLARVSWQRLRTFYSLEGFEIVPSTSASSATVGDDEELTGESFNRRAGPTEIEDRIAARAFLGGVHWESVGWMERFVSRFLDPQERVITEFLVAQNPGWTRSFRWSFWVWLVSCMIAVLLGQLGGTLIFFTAYILATASLPLFGGDWRGMRQAQAGGVNLPGFALYPIAFHAIARILLKVNLIRIFAALPFLLSFAVIAAWKLGENPLGGLVIGTKLIGILLCVQPLFVLLPISTTSNDTSRMRTIWFFVFLPSLILLVGCAVGVFLNTHFGAILLCFILIFMLSFLLHMVYRRAYRRGQFDLLNQRGVS